MMVEFGQLNRKDPHTVSNFEVFLSKHIDLCWKLDFESKSLSGYVIIAFERVNCSNETALTLDASELRISSITLLSDGGAETKLQFTHSKNATKFGGSLTFNLPEALDSFAIRIDYETMEGCSALQWLSPAQTYGKKHPFMFSQCQAIHARTMLPCQDTPMVKTTFSALIQAPSPMTAVMSANVRNVEESQEGFNSIAFKQTTPIPVC